MISKFSTNSIYSGKKNNKLFGGIKDGSTKEKMAPNASYLRSLGLPDGMYWIDVNGSPRKIYCDLNTNSSAWYLIGYQPSSSGRDLSVEHQGSYEPLLRYNVDGNGVVNGSRAEHIVVLPLINASTQLAFSWNQAGLTPSGGILSYDNAVSFNTPSNTMTLNGSTLNPAVGTFVTGSTNSETFATSLTNLKGSHGLASLGTYYTRKTSFTVNYGNSYGIVGHPSQVPGDWGPDGQVFRAIYFSRNGNTNSSYITTSGTGSGYVPSVIALWAKSA